MTGARFLWPFFIIVRTACFSYNHVAMPPSPADSNPGAAMAGPAIEPVPPAAPLPAPDFGEPERRLMLDLARQALARAVGHSEHSASPLVPVPPGLIQPKACFVTLTKHGALRGCVGNLAPHAPLYQTVAENARRAALRDPRFPPVQASELDDLKIEISVLNDAQPLHYESPEQLLSLLRPNQDGVLLQIGGRLAMFLPQVWQQLPDKVQFLDRLAEKAGCPASAWRNKDTSVSVYSVESFGEN